MSILCVVQHGKDNRFLCPKVVLANGVLLLDRGHISYGLFIHQLPIDVAILSCLPSPNHKKSNHVTVREKLKYLLWSLPNQQDYSKPDPETKECMKYIPAGGNFTDIPSEFRPRSVHDQMDSPRTALIWSKGMKGFYLIGDHNNYAFINELDHFLTKSITLRMRELGMDYFEVSGHHDKWNLESLFASRTLQQWDQLVFGLSGFEAESLGSTSDNQIRMLNLRSQIA
jgi:hypothetical protein